LGGTRNRGDRNFGKLHQLWRHSQGAISIGLPEAMIKVKEDEIAIGFRDSSARQASSRDDDLGR